MMGKTYKGRCFCGAVEFELHGEPEVMAYCHCKSCRHWSAGQVNAFTLWTPENFKITKGEEKVAAFDKTAATENRPGTSNRKWCTTCGGHLYIDHPPMGMVDIPAALIEGFDFQPAFHVHYQDTVHRIKDGLPKFKDLPEAAGGSGEELAE
ncbi:MAG: aldehyde-activating protein [Desulfuromonas sp.]|nr:MAG: aldehyde-activating protein [Desulfuromonas sp.]